MADISKFLGFLQNDPHSGEIMSFILGHTLSQHPELNDLVEVLGWRFKDFPENTGISWTTCQIGAIFDRKPIADALRACYGLPTNGTATPLTAELDPAAKVEEAKGSAPAQPEQIGEAVYPAGQEPASKPAEPDATAAPAPEEGTGDGTRPTDEEEFLEEDPDDLLDDQADRKEEYSDEDPGDPTDWEEENPDHNAPSAYLSRGCTCRPTVYFSADYVNFSGKEKGPGISGLEISLPLNSEIVVELGHCPLRITADDTTPDYYESREGDADSKYPPSLECDGHPVTDDPAGDDGDDESPFEDGTVVTH